MRVLARLRRPVLALAAAGLLLVGLPVPASAWAGSHGPAGPAVSTFDGGRGPDAVVDRGGGASVLAALPAPIAAVAADGAFTVLLVLAGLAGALLARRVRTAPSAGLRVRGPPRRVPTSTPAR